MFDNLNDTELDALLVFKKEGKLDSKTLDTLSDDALDAMLSIKKPTSANTAPVDNIDHSLPKGFGTKAYADANKKEEKGLWEEVKKFGSKAKREFGALLEGADNVANAVSPVEVKISDSPNTLRKTIDKALTPDDDVSFETYKKINQLSKTASGFHDVGIDEVKAEDVKSYNDNLHHLLVERMGYADVGQAEDGKYYVTDKEGKVTQLNKNTVTTVITDLLGDKGEVMGAMVGAKKGYDYGKVGGTKGKVIGAMVGGATGAALGNVGDQLLAAIETGEKLSMSQRVSEMNKSAVLDVAGGVVGSAVINVAGKAITLPADATKKVYGHFLNGNIDGAKKILKTDLGIDDAYIDDALEQMQKSQKESYGVEKNVIADAVETAKSGEIKKALADVGDGALDTLGNAQAKEEFLATAMSHPQGSGLVKEALASNPKGALELEKSIDGRAKQVLTSVDSVTGTEAKGAVNAYEKRVHDQYSDMRDTFSDAFKETSYRFNLGDLKLDSVLSDLEARVTDPYIKERFKGMVGAVENIIEGSKNGVGVETDVNALLDVRQMMNKFYRKNKSAFDLKPDKDSFRELIKGIDDEVERAMGEHLTPEISKDLLGFFDDARGAYKEMYDIQDGGLYKSLMADGKSAAERVTALLKHAKDDAGELQTLLKNLGSEESRKIEETLIESVLTKYTKGASEQMQSIDYAKAIDDFKALSPFLKSDGAKRSVGLVEDIFSKYRHDYDLGKAVKNVSEMVNAGGIGSSVQGRMEVAATSKIFRYVMTLIPWGETPKRLALQRHIGTALKKSRTPVDLAKRLSADNIIPNTSRKHLKELIKIHSKTLKAETLEQQKRAAKELDEIEARIAKEQELKAREVVDFVVPDITELRAVQKLYADDSSATLARTIRAIQEGKATTADVQRYLKAKESLGGKFEKQLEKEVVAGFPVKYRDVGTKEIMELESLRDYLMSNPNLKFGNEFNPQSFRALLFDLKQKGVPRSMAHDNLYDELRMMYDALKNEIDDAYGDSLF